ncbi:zinc ABC transporter permease [Suicoccus acidiformans]|uniref:Zinc ABC transporter permease n=1 Tax=Suicoccus acidiformans TaxID=2036206 RepID=A0A347WN17_9LACT|nr:metal ABC transporter permease [Suicoccus acidiformans]AXY26474.1 zinc ABC transporter permease [Suicoccus acidiformans]
MLEFEFMRRALLAGGLLSIMVPLIGIVMVSRKTSMIGDALAHCSLVGVGLGLILGINPTTGAVFSSIIAAFAIEGIRERFPQYGDMATAVTMSIGLGLAAILSDFAPGGNTFESYLFGSISAITLEDITFIVLAFIVVVFFSVKYYGALLDISIDPSLARLSGVPVGLINIIFTILAAITIALATQVVGALLVSSLLVLPVATSLMLCRSYLTTLLSSVCLGLLYMLGGLILSYTYDIRPGGAIVLLAVLGMGLAWLMNRFKKA